MVGRRISAAMRWQLLEVHTPTTRYFQVLGLRLWDIAFQRVSGQMISWPLHVGLQGTGLWGRDARHVPGTCDEGTEDAAPIAGLRRTLVCPWLWHPERRDTQRCRRAICRSANPTGCRISTLALTFTRTCSRWRSGLFKGRTRGDAADSLRLGICVVIQGEESREHATAAGDSGHLRVVRSLLDVRF